MNIKEQMQKRENMLSAYACKSSDSRGRVREETRRENDYRSIFAHDRDRILHSHAFRREKDKTQVFILPKNDHVMTRLTHTLEVAQIGKTMAVALNLNSELVEAIAYGHDCSHTCFGHAGERTLDAILKEHGYKDGYKHAAQAYHRLIELSGLNLTYEVLDGIRWHSGIAMRPDASTLEGQLIPFADKIAYLTSDMENAISMGLISGYPEFVQKHLGKNKSEIISTLVEGVIEASWDKPQVSMDESVYKEFVDFYQFNYNEIYFNPVLKMQNKKCEAIINYLFEYLMQYPEKFEKPDENADIIRNIVDYIAGMTDKYAMDLFREFGE